jgi:hypothetical protein
MKRIFIIFCLFGLILNSFSQDEVNTDYLDASTEITLRDSTLLEIIDANAPSGTARDAGSGMSLDGNALDFDGTLNKDADILGAANSMSLGTAGSKLNVFQVNSSGNLIYNSDANIIFNPSGTLWTLNGAYWISAGGDTLATNATVQSLIAASEPVLPFNWEYTFSSTITDSRPGVGLFRLNNATLSNVTSIYLDYFDANGVAKNDFLAMADTGSSIVIQTDVNNYALYKLTNGYTDAGNYYKYNVTYQSHSGVISGLNTIDLDISNSTGSGGGLADSTFSVVTAEDTLKTPLITDNGGGIINIEGETGVNIKAEAGLNGVNISAYGIEIATLDNGYPIIIDTDGIIYTLDNNGLTSDNQLNFISGSGQFLTLTSDTFIGMSSGGNVEITSDNGKYIIISDTLYLDGTNGTTANNIKAKNFFGRIFQGDKAVLDTLELAGTQVTGVQTSKYVMENTEVDKIQFNPTDQAHSEGTVFYDTNCKAITAYNDISGFKEELGRGINVRFFNNTGSTITNGTLIRSTGGKVNGSITFTADLAGNGSLDSLQGIAMATVDVLDNTFGIATLVGQVNGLNTSMYNDNDLLWVGSAGTVTDTSPNPPNYDALVGRVVYADADSGAIYMFPVSETKYAPAPTFSAFFNDSTITITNPGISIYALITNATNDLFTERLNYGFQIQGDSISPLQSGIYNVGISYSFYGDASQNDAWNIGVFKNGSLEYKSQRTSSTTNRGGVPFTIPIELSTTDWVSFRIENSTSAVRQAVFVDGVISFEYITATE